MKANMGNTDKLVRILAALLIAGLYFSGQITGIAAIVLVIVAVIFVATSSISFCPIYKVLGVSTKKKNA